MRRLITSLKGWRSTPIRRMRFMSKTAVHVTFSIGAHKCLVVHISTWSLRSIFFTDDRVNPLF